MPAVSATIQVFIEPETDADGNKKGKGHYAPVIKNKDGEFEVIAIPQKEGEKNTCFGQVAATVVSPRGRVGYSAASW